MDHAHPYLNESIQVLRVAGIRHVFMPAPVVERDLLDTDAWKRILGRIPPAPRFVWTYDTLGDDLLGTPNKLRGQLWRRIIASLRLPTGSIAFVPYILPEDNGSTQQFPAFAQALRRIRPQAVMVFSDQHHDQLLQCVDALRGSVDILPSLVFSPTPEHLLGLADDALEPLLSQFFQQLNLSARSA